ncbi:MAG: (2Fe-2S)-binding protein [Ilumatobacteraceae bacterium]|nr:(2Fe-2S)-binding protein [Ilumatobacteraceae bacterium]
MSERVVRKAIDRGASTVAEVGDRCRAGTCCQGCHGTIEAMLDAARCTDVTVRLSLASGA